MLKKNISLLFLVFALSTQSVLCAPPEQEGRSKPGLLHGILIFLGIAAAADVVYEAGKDSAHPQQDEYQPGSTPQTVHVHLEPAPQPRPQQVHVHVIPEPVRPQAPQTVIHVSSAQMREAATAGLESAIAGGQKSDNDRVSDIRQCLRNGANPNIAFNDVPALNLAVDMGRPAVVRELLNGGARPPRYLPTEQVKAVGALLRKHVGEVAPQSRTLRDTINNAITRVFYGVNTTAAQAAILHRIDKEGAKYAAADRLAVVKMLHNYNYTVQPHEVSQLTMENLNNTTSLITKDAEDVFLGNLVVG